MRALALEAAELLAKDGYAVELLDIPRFEVLYDKAAPASTPKDYQIARASQDDASIILHSSGTSAFPKPIRMSSRNFIAWGSTLCEFVVRDKYLYSERLSRLWRGRRLRANDKEETIPLRMDHFNIRPE